MNDSIIAKRYAKAIFKLGKDHNRLKSYTPQLRVLQNIIRDNENFQFLLQNPVINGSSKKAILKKLFDGKFHNDIISLLTLLVDKRREAYLPDIIRAYIKMYQNFANIQQVDITTAHTFDEATITKIKNILDEMTGKTSEIQTNIDESLIGGFLLRVDDKQLDATVSGQLNAIRKQLSS